MITAKIHIEDTTSCGLKRALSEYPKILMRTVVFLFRLTKSREVCNFKNMVSKTLSEQ